jgi:nicotinic acid mononucleotide adenylyltransferase
MNPISKTLIQHILEEETSSVGVFGGGFKPPTKGHFAVVEKILNNYNINKLIIFVGSGVRDNISQQQSLDIWNVYKKYLPKKVEIVPSQVPITSIYDYAKENPNTEVKWFLGAREENIQDRVDFEKRTKSAASKPNLTPILITTPLEISGTKTRQSLQNKEEFFTYLPDMLSDSDKETVYSILSGINEWVPEPEIDNIEDYADDVLNPLDLKIPPHFVDRVNDRRNNPSIEADELYDFFDKLSDEKDDLEDLLDDEGEIVATDSDTNINIPLAKDNERINTVVAKTIMRKKNFLTPNKKLVFEKTVGDSIVCDNCGWTWKIKDGGNDLYICHKCDHDNTPKQTNNFFQSLEDKEIDFTAPDEDRVKYYEEYYKNLSPSDFKVEKQKDKVVISNISKKKLEHNSEFKKLLVSLTMYMMDHINIDPLPNVEFVEDDNKNADDLLGKTAYYDPNNQTIVLYTYNRHPKDILRSYAHEMIHHKQNLEGKIQNIQGQNINEDDYLKELEAEAYLQGNGLLFRGWENSLKND